MSAKVAACINTNRQTPNNIDDQPGEAIPIDLSISGIGIMSNEKEASTAQAMPTRTSTSSENTIRAFNP